MNATDCRDKNFSAIKAGLQGRLEEIYTAWLEHGPCTTRQLAEKIDVDILTVRPRTTDLLHLGLVAIAEGDGREGIYRARAQAEWEAWSRKQTGGQLFLI